MSITAKTKKTQKAALLAYLKKHRSKGITSLEAAKELDIVCLHKRIAEIENTPKVPCHTLPCGTFVPSTWHYITRTRETTPSGSRVTRYKLAR